MRFPTEFIEEVRAKTSIVDLISQDVRLKRAGHKFTGLCPFHTEKTPSFHLFPQEENYHCFGCGAHGTAFTYVMDKQHLSFPEAVAHLAHMAGLQLPAQAQDSAETQAYEEALKLNQLASHFFIQNLHHARGEKARDYLRMRGVSEDTIAHFAIGYAPNDWENLKGFLVSKGFTVDAIERAGLIVKNEETGRLYDRFRDRLIFPITDHQDRIIAFGGRTLSEQQPKYLNSPETAAFKKSSVLYNRARARRALKGEGNVIVAEGYMDVITLYEFGFKEAVAPLGTAMTQEHLKGLWRFSPEPILCLDGDQAGQKAMDRVVTLALPLLEPGKSIQFMTLPAGDDPDSFLRTAGVPAFKERMRRATSLFDRLIAQETALHPIDTPERKAGFIGRLREKGKLINDPLVRRMYQNFWEEKYPDSTFQQRKIATPPPKTSRIASPLNLRHRMEQAILVGILIKPSILGQYDERLGAVSFKDPNFEKIRVCLLNYCARQLPLDKKQVEAHLTQQGFTEILVALFKDHGLKALFPFLQLHPDDAPFTEQWAELFEKIGETKTPMASAELFDEAGWARFLEQRQQQMQRDEEMTKKLEG